MSTGYTRQSSGNIVSGHVIASADINNEFNQLQSAFNATSGHAHDGSTGAGAPITNLSGLSGSGIISYNNAGVFNQSTLTAGPGITVTNGTGVSGNPTVAMTTPFVLVSTQTASSTILTWTGLTTYSRYRLDVSNIVASGAGPGALQFGYGAGPTWVTAGYYYSDISSDANLGFVTNTITNAAFILPFGVNSENFMSGSCEIFNFLAAVSASQYVYTTGQAYGAAANTILLCSGGITLANSPLTAIRLGASNAGTFSALTSGSASLYVIGT